MNQTPVLGVDCNPPRIFIFFTNQNPFPAIRSQSNGFGRNRTGLNGAWRGRGACCVGRPAAGRIHVAAARLPRSPCSDGGTSLCAGPESSAQLGDEHLSCAHLGTCAHGASCGSRRTRRGFERAAGATDCTLLGCSIACAPSSLTRCCPVQATLRTHCACASPPLPSSIPSGSWRRGTAGTDATSSLTPRRTRNRVACNGRRRRCPSTPTRTASLSWGACATPTTTRSLREQAPGRTRSSL